MHHIHLFCILRKFKLMCFGNIKDSETDVSVVEVTSQNFRLLSLIDTDLKSFLRYCDKL